MQRKVANMKLKCKPYVPLRITSPYGKRSGNLPVGATAWHDGIDIGRDYKYGGAYSNDPCGPVFAVLDGMVTESKFVNGRGYTIKVDHGVIEGKRTMTLYQHLHKDNRATAGKKVKAGDVIAQMGRTGMGSDMMVHLHFELHFDGKTVDPAPYVKIAPDKIEKTNVVVKKEEDDEVVTQTKINLNGKVKTVNVINKDGNNYIKLQDIRDDKIVIGYENKMPTVTSR